MDRKGSRAAFTLIELLVVIAIIAILAVVVVLTLNPIELLRQSRDSNRVSDMSTLTSVVGEYTTDQSGSASFNMGSSSVIYISIPDPAATSTAGTNCSTLGLPALPAAYVYHCAASSTFRNINGTGWIPINLTTMSTGAPLGSLPIDPTNTSSSHLYYTYTTNGAQYEVTSVMESQKYGQGGSGDVIDSDGGTLASVYEKGSKLGLEPMDYGDPSLVGYWTFNEGTSTIAYDYSGNNATGSWSGTQAGTNGYYSAGKIGPYAGYFNGSNDYVTLPNVQLTIPFTISYWLDPTLYESSTQQTVFSGGCNTFESYTIGTIVNFSVTCVSGGPSYAYLLNQWQLVTAVAPNASTFSLYLNGALVTSTASNATLASSTLTLLGKASGAGYLNGYLDDFRVYNRALSATQIAAMYGGGK